MVEKRYPLSLARTYVSHWGTKEAVRELLQNALDSDGDFGYAFDDDGLTIISRYVTLEPRTLLLGASSKAGDDSKIGAFGEGYKLALLVLVREGMSVTIHNGSRLWTPAFVYDEAFGEEMLVVVETEAESDNRSVEYLIQGLDAEQLAEIRESCLFMQPAMHDAIGTKFGTILPGRAGRLYVGGLAVCDTKMAYGYDFKPSVLRLERDRQTVDSFQFETMCSFAWRETAQWELVARLMEEGVPDVEDMKHVGIPDGLKDACAQRYMKRHGDAIPVSSQREADDLNKAGEKRKTTYVGPSYGAAVLGSTVYRENTPEIVQAKSPRQVVEQWFDDNKGKMPRLPKVAFKKLMDAAKEWKAA